MTYPAEMADRIVEMLPDQNLNQICKLDGMPSRATVERWMREDPEFEARCVRAREEHAERLFDDLQNLEDQVLTGELKPDAAKVVLSSRQWRLEKLKQRRFGAKVDMNLSGAVSFTKIETVLIDPNDSPEG